MSTDLKSETATPQPDTKMVDTEATETKVDSAASPEADNQQVQQILDKISGLLAELPDYVTNFFKEYQRPLITVGLVLTAFISVKLLLAMLDAINEIPLLAPTFELVGLGYTAWFVYRFILKDANRQELGDTFNSLKDQVLGKR